MLKYYSGRHTHTFQTVWMMGRPLIFVKMSFLPRLIYYLTTLMFSAVQFSLSVVSNSLRPHGLQHAWLPWHITNSWSWLKFMSIEFIMPSNQLILCHPLLPSSIFPIIRVFSNESALHIRWPQHWSFSSSISTSNEFSGLISFRMDWLDLLAVQGTLKSLLQHHSSKASILRCQVSL